MAITFHRNVGAPKAVLLVTFTSLGLTALTTGLPADQTVKTFEVEVQVMAEGKPAEGA